MLLNTPPTRMCGRVHCVKDPSLLPAQKHIFVTVLLILDLFESITNMHQTGKVLQLHMKVIWCFGLGGGA